LAEHVHNAHDLAEVAVILEDGAVAVGLLGSFNHLPAYLDRPGGWDLHWRAAGHWPCVDVVEHCFASVDGNGLQAPVPSRSKIAPATPPAAAAHGRSPCIGSRRLVDDVHVRGGNPAFEIGFTEHGEDYKIIVRYVERDLLQSGWLVGEETLAKKAAMVSAKLGEGKVILIGFRTQHRAQTHGTFRLLFNALVR